MEQSTFKKLREIASLIRADIVTMSNRTGLPHVGSALSCVEILVGAYFSAMNIDPSKPSDPKRDRLIFSKGHACAALYSALAHRGFCPLSKAQN